MRVLAIVLLFAACRGDSAPKKQEAPPPVPADAAVPTTPEALIVTVPTAKAIDDNRALFRKNTGRPPTEHVGIEVMKILTRLGWRTATSDHPGAARNLRNVLAILQGASEDAVIVGAHRDDAASTATLIEIARSFTAVTRNGWKPRRTLILGFWDTEGAAARWIADNKKMVGENTLAYLHLGPLGAEPLTVHAVPAAQDLAAACTPGAKPTALTDDAVGFHGETNVPMISWARPGTGDAPAAELAQLAGSIALCVMLRLNSDGSTKP